MSQYAALMHPADLADELRAMVESPPWRAIVMKLETLEAAHVRSLRTAEGADVHREQGALRMLDEVRSLPQVLIAELTREAQAR